MKRLLIIGVAIVLVGSFLSATAKASLDSTGPNGINSRSLPYTGFGIGIGEVEDDRPGDQQNGDDAAHRNSTIDPIGVFVRDRAALPNELVGQHAEEVAGVMISTEDTAEKGVSTGAFLYASAIDGPAQSDSAVTAQFVALQNSGDVWAINLSFADPLVGNTQLDGSSLFTLFVDWSAAEHNVLYVAGGRDQTTPSKASVPMDNFNGITVATSAKNGAKYRQVSGFNKYDEQLVGSRTAIGLIAPGENIATGGLMDSEFLVSGTSVAAPHVVGTVALLQEYADRQITNGVAGWGSSARQHQVMKAVLLNSADKINNVLGMDRTVVDFDGLTPWHHSDTIPLDPESGAGELDAKRAFQQFSAGQTYCPPEGTVAAPAIGWDYTDTDGLNTSNRYQLSQLSANQYVSITLAWDRDVVLADDVNGNGQYDPGDTFFSFELTNLNLYLMPRGDTNLTHALAKSVSPDSSVEHIFFQVPNPGMYDIIVAQASNGIGLFGEQLYGLAWWTQAPATHASSGDYDGNGIVQANDYTVWKNAFGTANGAVDGNGDGVVDAADYTIWRDHLGQMVGSGSAAAVPEPSAVVLLLVGVFLCARRSATMMASGREV